MNTYPTKPVPAIGSARAIIKPALRSQSEAGYIYTRAKFTRQKSKYTLNYPLLTKPELDILINFFKQNQGQSFKFTHPLENIEKICVFAADELSISDDFANYSSLKVELVEI